MINVCFKLEDRRSIKGGGKVNTILRFKQRII